MEIVINKCFGGFGLSPEAEVAVGKRKGYAMALYKHKDVKQDIWVKTKKYDAYTCAYFKADMGESFCMQERGEYFSYYTLERNDPDLVAIVKELGTKANGMCADLAVVEIPDDVKWNIEEYDGSEHIAEDHRTWG